MGMIKSETQGATTNHFSHPHPLKLINHQPQVQQLPNLTLPSCAGCNLQPHGSIYTCTTCPFFLHKKCFDMPKKFTHPSHKSHPFILLPKSPYPGGFFTCDACGDNGDAFSYHCQPCGMDLHILCSVMPLSLTHASHPHKLYLTFGSPYGSLAYCCDICKMNGSNSSHWLYRCNSCGFDAHLKCASGQQPALQQPNFTSFMNHLNQPPSQQHNLTSFMNNLNNLQSQIRVTSQTQQQGFGATGIPGAGHSTPQVGGATDILATIEAFRRMADSSNAISQANREARAEVLQMIQSITSLNNGSDGGFPGLNAFGGGDFGGGGGGAWRQDYLQGLMNGGNGGGVTDLLQMLGGGGNGTADLLGGDGGGVDLSALLGGFSF